MADAILATEPEDWIALEMHFMKFEADMRNYPTTIYKNSTMQKIRELIDSNPDLIKEIITKALESPRPVTPQSGMRQVEAILGHNTYDRLPEIKAPTLIIHGDADRMSPVGNARILASRIPKAKLAILKKMGHGFMIEAFDESNRIMLEFLKKHSGTER